MLLSSRTSLGILSLIYLYQKLWKLPICCSCQVMEPGGGGEGGLQINMDLEARRYEREIICHISPVHWTLDFLLVCLGNEFLRCSQLDANVWHVILRLMSGHSHVPRDTWHVTSVSAWAECEHPMKGPEVPGAVAVWTGPRITRGPQFWHW